MSSSSPLSDTEKPAAGWKSMLFGVSAPIRVMSLGASSIECIHLSCSAGSSLAWKSANVELVSSPPKTDW